MKTTELKLCKDCHWVHVPILDRIFLFYRPYKFALCTNPMFVSQERFFVDGRSPEMSDCGNNRTYPHRCGPSGKEWRPKIFEDIDLTGETVVEGSGNA